MVLRSLVYSVLFYLVTLALMIFGSPAMLFGRRGVMKVVRLWSSVMMGLHRLVVGAGHRFIGFDRVPEGGAILAIKHQSTWETVSLIAHLRDPVFILKRELMWIPLFGWWAMAARVVPINRGKRAAAMRAMTEAARTAVASGRQIVIFPEGTRREAGAPPAYKFGVIHLYNELGVPIVPIALNSGTVWPRKAVVHRRGTIVAEVLEPVPAGLDAFEAFNLMQRRIEEASDRLLVEAERRGDDLPDLARSRAAEVAAGAPTRFTRMRNRQGA